MACHHGGRFRRRSAPAGSACAKAATAVQGRQAPREIVRHARARGCDATARRASRAAIHGSRPPPPAAAPSCRCTCVRAAAGSRSASASPRRTRRTCRAALPSVHIRIGTSSTPRPASSTAPAPVAPSTPKPCASSTSSCAPVSLAGGGDLTQRRNVAIHAEHAVGHHQCACRRADRGQLVAQRRDVCVRVARKPRAGGEARVEQRSVIEPVLEHVIAAADQHGGNGEVRHVASRKQQRARSRDELGEFCFERVMFGVVTAHEMRGAAAHAPPARGLAECRDDPRVVREPQVIIAAEGKALASFDRDANPARFTRVDRASSA